VLLDFNGTVKICDLGIAKFVNQRNGNGELEAGGGGVAGGILTTLSSGQG